MAVYKCSVCGYIYDEEKEGKPFRELEVCPVCKQSVEKFVLVESSGGVQNGTKADGIKGESGKVTNENETENSGDGMDLSYDSRFARQDASCRYMEEIHQMAVTGKSIGGSMGTRMPMPDWDDILILGAQLNPPPVK